MPTYSPSTPFPAQFINPETNELHSGGTLRSYYAGTSAPAPMFFDSTGTTFATSVQLNAGGYPEVSGTVRIIWLQDGVAYKFVLQDADSGSVWTVDNISTIISGGVQFTAGCKTISDLKSAAGPLLVNGVRISAAQVAEIADTGAVICTTWNNTSSKVGGAAYEIKTRADHRLDIGNPSWVPDGYGDHYLLGGTTYVAVLLPEAGMHNAYAFGVIPDWVSTSSYTDNTAAIQAFFDYYFANPYWQYKMEGTIGYDTKIQLRLSDYGGYIDMSRALLKFEGTGDAAMRVWQSGTTGAVPQKTILGPDLVITNGYPDTTYGIETNTVNTCIFRQTSVTGFVTAIYMHNSSTWQENVTWERPKAINFRRFFEFKVDPGQQDSFARTVIKEPFGNEGIGCDYWFYIHPGANMYDSTICNIAGNRTIANTVESDLFYLGGDTTASYCWGIHVEDADGGYLYFRPTSGASGSRAIRFMGANSFTGFNAGIQNPAGAATPNPDKIAANSFYPSIRVPVTTLTGSSNPDVDIRMDRDAGFVYGDAGKSITQTFTLAYDTWHSITYGGATYYAGMVEYMVRLTLPSGLGHAFQHGCLSKNNAFAEPAHTIYHTDMEAAMTLTIEWPYGENRPRIKHADTTGSPSSVVNMWMRLM